MRTHIKNKMQIDLAIIQLSARDGKLPEVAEIEEHTLLPAITIVRNLDEDYPKELIITLLERKVLNAFNENPSLKAIEKATGVKYSVAANTISRLRDKGFIKCPYESKNQRKGKNEKEIHSNVTFIVITSDLVHNSLNLKDARGYLDPFSYRFSKAYVYKDCVRHHVNVTDKDYETIGGRV